MPPKDEWQSSMGWGMSADLGWSSLCMLELEGVADWSSSNIGSQVVAIRCVRREASEISSSPPGRKASQEELQPKRSLWVGHSEATPNHGPFCTRPCVSRPQSGSQIMWAMTFTSKRRSQVASREFPKGLCIFVAADPSSGLSQWRTGPWLFSSYILMRIIIYYYYLLFVLFVHVFQTFLQINCAQSHDSGEWGEEGFISLRFGTYIHIIVHCCVSSWQFYFFHIICTVPFKSQALCYMATYGYAQSNKLLALSFQYTLLSSPCGDAFVACSGSLKCGFRGHLEHAFS